MDKNQISRRDFVAKTALIGAGLVIGSSARAAASEQSEKINNGRGQETTRGENKMKTRKLGKLEVSELGSGCMSISANYGPAADRSQGIMVLRTAHEKVVPAAPSPRQPETVFAGALAP